MGLSFFPFGCQFFHRWPLSISNVHLVSVRVRPLMSVVTCDASSGGPSLFDQPLPRPSFLPSFLHLTLFVYSRFVVRSSAPKSEPVPGTRWLLCFVFPARCGRACGRWARRRASRTTDWRHSAVGTEPGSATRRAFLPSFLPSEGN